MVWSEDVHKSQSLPSRYRAVEKLRRAGAPVQRVPNAGGLLPIVAVASATGALVLWRKENRRLQRRRSLESIPVIGGLLAGLQRVLERAQRGGGRAAAPARQSASADAWRQQRPMDMAASAAAQRSQVCADARGPRQKGGRVVLADLSLGGTTHYLQGAGPSQPQQQGGSSKKKSGGGKKKKGRK